MDSLSHEDILRFWFEEIEQSLWWSKDEAFDVLVVEKFSKIHAKAVRCELFKWRSTSPGRLAEIIVLDQFSRNMFRETAQAFVYDSIALVLSQEAVAIGADQCLNPFLRSFLYMPYMHSESLVIHEQAVHLYEKNGVQSNLDFEIRHKQIIEKFSRYPHRNKALGRVSTAAEIEFLQTLRSGF